MGNNNDSHQATLEAQRLELERYKIQLDYRKFVLGSVFVAVAIAAIPPLFQLATAGLEYVKGLRDQQIKQEEFHEIYIKGFLENALNQDIELRIRLAEYFKFVSTDKYRQSWADYHTELVKYRDRIRGHIDTLEADWQQKAQAHGGPDVSQLERHLAWAYNEVGYAARDRSATVDPRASVREALVSPSAHNLEFNLHLSSLVVSSVIIRMTRKCRDQFGPITQLPSTCLLGNLGVRVMLDHFQPTISPIEQRSTGRLSTVLQVGTTC